ncbi:MAG TPA: hypothetical protein VF080_02095 [Solirubrobacteraceae bacterium]
MATARPAWERPPLDADGEVEPRRLDKRGYEKELERLQVELTRLQEWIVHEGLRVVVIFEGRDTAGKGGTIKRISEKTNPRVVRTVALGTPTERERTQWYFQRYVAHLPAAGEMVLFDRSWYNRAGVEHVMGFCTQDEYEEFMRTCPQFERDLLRSGLILVKYCSRSATRSRSAGSRRACAIPPSIGSSAAWISRRAGAGSTTRRRRTTCSPTPTRATRRGTSSRPTTSGPCG